MGNGESTASGERGRIAREGYPFLLLALAAAAGGSFLGLYWLAGILAVLGLFILYFFRDPARVVPQGPGLIVSPGDGRVVEVRSGLSGPGLPSDGYGRVAIFLSIFDVHVNRAPVSGTVTSVRYTPGRFLPAFRSDAGTVNERNQVEIRAGESGEIVCFSQIAGLIARRIACYKRAGDPVRRGERVGLIRFGSRVEVLVPPGFHPDVAPGDRVRGGASVIARRREGDSRGE